VLSKKSQEAPKASHFALQNASKAASGLLSGFFFSLREKFATF